MDHLKAALATCFPCMIRPHVDPEYSDEEDYFPDSIRRGLLSEEHPPLHQLESKLTRWDLFSSWLSPLWKPQTMNRLGFEGYDDEESTALQFLDGEEDAQLLQDLSFQSATPRAPNGQSVQGSPVLQPSPRRGGASDQVKQLTAELRGLGPKNKPRSLTSKSSSRTSSHDSPKIQNCRLESSTQPRKPTQRKSLASPRTSSSSITTFDVTDHSDLFSVQNTDSSQTTSDHSKPSLDSHMIKAIHSRYNAACREMFGCDLSRPQVQQIFDYMLSTGQLIRLDSCPSDAHCKMDSHPSAEDAFSVLSHPAGSGQILASEP